MRSEEDEDREFFHDVAASGWKQLVFPDADARFGIGADCDSHRVVDEAN